MLLGKSLLLKMIIVVSSLVTSFYFFVFTIQRKEEMDRKVHRFKLEHCDCERTLPQEHVKKVNQYPLDYTATTCGQDAYQRGLHQKVAAFSFYGDKNSSIHKSKHYFEEWIVKNKENI